MSATTHRKRPRNKDFDKKKENKDDDEQDEIQQMRLKLEQERGKHSQQLLIMHRLVAAVSWMKDTDVRYRNPPNNCCVGDWVIEDSSMCINARLRGAEPERLLKSGVGRLLLIQEACVSCLEGTHNEDEIEDEEDGGELHHWNEKVYFIETPDGRLVYWHNCTLISLDTHFSIGCSRDVDGTGNYVHIEAGTPSKIFWLHGDQSKSLDRAFDENGRERSDDFVQSECRRQAQECVGAALVRHDVENWVAQALQTDAQAVRPKKRKLFA